MMINIFFKCLIAPLLIFSSTTEGLSLNNSQSTNRRTILQKASHFGTAIIGASTPFITSTFNIANAQTDAQFKDVGQQEAAPAGETPFQTLSSGVQVKDFRVGSGPTVGNGSKVELTMKGRLINLNGVVFYDTKSNDPNGFGEGTPLVFTVGDKSALPGLESGIADMRRGGIRRIIVPADQGYGGYPGLQPQPLTDMERRALDSVIKNPRRDQTVMFDVKVERVR